MMGKNHTSISVAWGFLIASPLLFHNPIYFVSLLIGVVLGAVFPDIYVKSHNPYGTSKTESRRYFHNDEIEREGGGGLMMLMGLVSYPAMHISGFLVSRFTKYTKDELLNHRMLMHSLLGVTLSLLLIFVPINLLLLIIGFWHPAFLVASFGVFIGALFHLFEDSCTGTGINFFYPFKEMGANRENCLRGKICTGKKSEKEAGKIFSQMYIYMGVIFIVYYIALRKLPLLAQYDFMEGMSVGGLILITTAMSLFGLVFMRYKANTAFFPKIDGYENSKSFTKR